MNYLIHLCQLKMIVECYDSFNYVVHSGMLFIQFLLWFHFIMQTRTFVKDIYVRLTNNISLFSLMAITFINLILFIDTSHFLIMWHSFKSPSFHWPKFSNLYLQATTQMYTLPFISILDKLIDDLLNQWRH